MDSRKILEMDQVVLVVAPMQGVTDYPYRKTLEKIGGMDAFLSEYIVVSNDNCYARREVKDVLKSWNDEHSKIPVIPQIISGVIPGALKAIEELKDNGILSVDVNMGCPTKAAIGRKCGSYQSENPDETRPFIDKIRQAVPCGLSIKARIGQTSTRNYSSLLEMINDSGCDFVTMHCRLATNGYRGEVAPELACEATRRLTTPLIYNGGLTDPKFIDKIANKIGAKGVMIGRGIMQNPWLFKQVKEFRETKKVTPPDRISFLSFFQDLYENYASYDLQPIGCLSKLKQLLSAFKYPSDAWSKFLTDIRRENDHLEFFKHIENIPDELLGNIGCQTNDYFSEFMGSHSTT